jgi:8-oxo-dGTP pyrophosphatase MutT (NUDIX family)
MSIYDVFQKGLRHGSESLAFDPKKRYAYVEHPTEGWRVYLRSAMFLHERGKPFNAAKFLVVKKRNAPYYAATWEPPKGQMEGKDKTNGSVLNLLVENVKRETEEEAHVHRIYNLTHTGLVFQGQEEEYPPNHFFQYHIFQGFVSHNQIEEAFETFKWIKEHPKGFARWKRDYKEKDAISWFNPEKTRLNPRWCPSIVALYLKEYSRK